MGIAFERHRDIGIVDHVVPVSKLNHFVGLIESNVFPWYFHKNTYGTNLPDISAQSGFIHLFVEDKRVNSDFWLSASSLVDCFVDSIGAVEPTVLRAQVNMVPKLKDTHNGVAHTDGCGQFVRTGYEWVTAILYLNDSDGDTLFYENGVITERFSPVKNRAVWFDGNVEHSGSVPTNTARRLVFNMNLEVKSWT